MPDVGAIALRFTILTASRSGPVRFATWGQFSDDFFTWTVPAENMKGRTEFVVPLSRPVRELLEKLRPHDAKDDDCVFVSGNNLRKPISENTMRKQLQKHYPNATVHGMRATFRTWAAEHSNLIDEDIAEMALAHKIGTKTQRAEFFYNRGKAMEIWSFWFEGRLDRFNEHVTLDDLLMQIDEERINGPNYRAIP